MLSRRVSLSVSSCLAALLLAGCSHHLAMPSAFGGDDDLAYARQPAPQRVAQGPRSDFTDIGYATWTEEEPSYRVFPGDEIEVTVPSAPELNKTQIVPPDGRLTLPLIAPVMAADKEIPQLAAALTQAY